MGGCVDVWMCGCVDVWLCGCVDYDELVPVVIFARNLSIHQHKYTTIPQHCILKQHPQSLNTYKPSPPNLSSNRLPQLSHSTNDFLFSSGTQPELLESTSSFVEFTWVYRGTLWRDNDRVLSSGDCCRLVTAVVW